ncbi:hypothetical protein [Flavobacterium sp. H4147]|uniref:hypothetical protein n=1 Tax=Flavobacterium sp. H4147 TaxID=3034149 RepID=UPI0023EE26E0|nr:hypothetical protein [Flavobacterium sp. H4147]
MKILKDTEGVTLTKVIPKNIIVNKESINIFEINNAENISENITFTIRGKKKDLDIILFTNTGLLSKKAKKVFDLVGAQIDYCRVPAKIIFSNDRLIQNEDYYYFSIPTKCAVIDLEKTTSYETWADHGVPKLNLFVYLDGKEVELDENNNPIFERGRLYVPILCKIEGLVLKSNINQNAHILYAIENLPVRPLVSEELAKAILNANLRGVELIEATGYKS